MKRKLNCLKYRLCASRCENVELSNILDENEKYISFKLLKNDKLLIYNLSVNEDKLFRYINIIRIKVCKLLRIVCKKIMNKHNFPEDIESLIMKYCMINSNDFSKIITELNNFRKLN